MKSPTQNRHGARIKKHTIRSMSPSERARLLRILKNLERIFKRTRLDLDRIDKRVEGLVLAQKLMAGGAI